ncbi:MAG: hypothetical protein ACOZCO_03220 [Bacteroidota bacterium]
MAIRAGKFTWYVQLGGYDYDRFDQKGETDYQKFIDEFEKFPWLEQLDSYNEIQQGTTPSLSVKDEGTGTDFWVSMAGDRNDHGYMLGYIYPKDKKRGFSPKTVRWLEIYATEDKQVVKDCFKLYFDRDYEKLETTIKRLAQQGERIPVQYGESPSLATGKRD